MNFRVIDIFEENGRMKKKVKGGENNQWSVH